MKKYDLQSSTILLANKEIISFMVFEHKKEKYILYDSDEMTASSSLFIPFEMKEIFQISQKRKFPNVQLEIKKEGNQYTLKRNERTVFFIKDKVITDHPMFKLILVNGETYRCPVRAAPVEEAVAEEVAEEVEEAVAEVVEEEVEEAVEEENHPSQEPAVEVENVVEQIIDTLKSSEIIPVETETVQTEKIQEVKKPEEPPIETPVAAASAEKTVSFSIDTILHDFVQILKDQDIDMNRVQIEKTKETPAARVVEKKKQEETKILNPKIYLRTIRFQNQNYKIPTIKLQPSVNLNYGNLYHTEVHPKNYIHSHLLALELEQENQSYLVYYYGLKYVLIKIEQELLLIQVHKNRSSETIRIPHTKESFKWTTHTYKSFHNGTLLIPMEQKRIYDNMYGTVHVVSQPSLFV
jgi:hypothetical protein